VVRILTVSSCIVNEKNTTK